MSRRLYEGLIWYGPSILDHPFQNLICVCVYSIELSNRAWLRLVLLLISLSFMLSVFHWVKFIFYLIDWNFCHRSRVSSLWSFSTMLWLWFDWDVLILVLPSFWGLLAFNVIVPSSTQVWTTSWRFPACTGLTDYTFPYYDCVCVHSWWVLSTDDKSFEMERECFFL